jgi:DNA polymerase-3 subunit beta
MKITLKASLLKEAIEDVGTTTSKNNQNPLLKGIYLQTEGNSLCLRSTNISTGFEKLVVANVEVEGSCVILAEVISRVFSNMSFGGSDMCELELEGDICKIKIGKHAVEVKTLPKEGFPGLPDVVGESFELSSETLVFGLKSVVFSVAKTEIKPEISGVHMYSFENQLVFVATDSYRLSEKKIEVGGIPENISVIIPEKNVKDIIKIFDKSKEKLTLTISQSSLAIKTEDGSYFITRLIEGKFPNYRQIIPSSPEAHVILLKEDVVRSLKIVSFFSDKTEQVTLECKPETITVFAQNFEVGSASETINATLKGEEFTIKVNSRYFEEFLSQVKDQSVVIKFTSQNKPIIFEGIDGNGFTYLVMPSYR